MIRSWSTECSVRLRTQGCVNAERAGVWVEGAGAIQLGDLADVSEIVRSPFIEHLLEGDEAELECCAVRAAAAGGIDLKNCTSSRRVNPKRERCSCGVPSENPSAGGSYSFK